MIESFNLWLSQPTTNKDVLMIIFYSVGIRGFYAITDTLINLVAEYIIHKDKK